MHRRRFSGVVVGLSFAAAACSGGDRPGGDGTGGAAAGGSGGEAATGGAGGAGASGGSAGASGTSGMGGAAGASGASGTSGVGGAAGASGASGTSGVGGAAGASGASGAGGVGEEGPGELGAGMPPVGPSADGGFEAAPTNPYGGRDFFVSPGGDDANDGSRARPWRTPGRLAGAGLAPGDRAFFQRGGVYRGTLTLSRSGAPGRPIVLSAYGNGAPPIISGAEVVDGWRRRSDGHYEASVALPEYAGTTLYFRGERQRLARFPNADAAAPWRFKEVDAANHPQESNGVRYLKDAALAGVASGSWVGARLVTRNNNWSYLPGRVTGWEPAQQRLVVDFRAIAEYANPYSEWKTYRWGYFLEGLLEFLDQPGEWIWEAPAGRLVFSPPDGGAPEPGAVEVPVRDYGFYLSRTAHVVVEELWFRHHAKESLHLWATEGVVLRRCRFEHAPFGIRSWDDSGTLIERNHLRHLLETAIHLGDTRGTEITGNHLEDIAMVIGAAPSAWSYFGISVASKTGATETYRVHGNLLERIGYIALAAAGSGVMERNIVSGALGILNDGGAIAFDHVRHDQQLHLRENLLLDCVGDVASVHPSYHHSDPMCHMVYFGDKSPSNTTVQGNVVRGASGAAVWVDHSIVYDAGGAVVPSMNQVVRGNVLFGNGIGVGQSDYSVYQHPDGRVLDCNPRAQSPCRVAAFSDVVEGNQVYATAAGQVPFLKLHVYSNDASNPIPGATRFGTSNDNVFVQPFSASDTVHLRYDFGSGTRRMTLAEWQAHSGEDSRSRDGSGAPDLAPPASRGYLAYNATFLERTVRLPPCLVELDGRPAPATVTLRPLGGAIYERRAGAGCPP